MIEQIFGWLAICFTFFGFGFQVAKIIVKKKTSSISLTTYSIAMVGAFTWLLYGIFAHAFHGGFENSIIVLFSCMMLYFILIEKFEKREAIIISSAIALITLTFIVLLIINTFTNFMTSSSKGLTMTLGFIAGICMSISFAPQVIKVFKTKNVREVSLWLSIFFGLAQVVLITYWASRSNTYQIGDWLPGVIFCSLVLTFQCLMIFGKIKYEHLNKMEDKRHISEGGKL